MGTVSLMADGKRPVLLCRAVSVTGERKLSNMCADLAATLHYVRRVRRRCKVNISVQGYCFY